MPDANLIVYVGGDVNAPLNIAAKDILSVWQATQGQPFDPPVFVSYASADRKKHVEPLVERLKEAGYSVWFDRESIEGGDDWKREIDHGLRRCVAVVAVLTPRSVDPDKHPWAHYEQTEALRLLAPVIPLIMEDCTYPPHFAEENLHYITLTDPNDDAAFEKLKEAIEKKIKRRGKWLTDQSPNVTRTFIGREAELRAVYKMLHGGGETLAITAVQGIGGIGKTMLAEELARRLAPRYPGGLIFETRSPQPPDPQDVLRKWAGWALGKEPDQAPTTAELRAMLAGHGQLFVVIDDVWPEDFASVKTLLEALPPDAERLIATRFAEGAEAIGAKCYRLERLGEADGIALLRDRLKNKGPEPEEALLKRLHEALGGHALALELAAGRVKDTQRMEKQVEELEARIRAGDVSELALNATGLGKDASLALSLELSLEALRKADAPLADRFIQLGIFAPDAPFDASGAAAVWEMDAGAAEKALDALVGYGLLVAGEGRFKQHMILRAYALGLLKQDTSQAEAAHNRHAEHYFSVADAVEEDWQEADHQAANIAQAAEWVCDRLGETAIAALGQADPPKKNPAFDETSAQVALVMALATRNYVHDRRAHAGLRWLQAGLAAARLQGVEKGESLLLNDLGLWHHNRGQLQKSLAYYEKSAEIDEAVGDRAGLATTLNNIGIVYRARGDLEQALDYYERALPIMEAVGNRAGLAATLNNIGMVYDARGELGQALDYYERALPIREAVGDRAGLATTLNNIGGVYRARGELEQALEYLERALPIMEAVGDRAGLANMLNNIGGVCDARGDLGKALNYYERALPIVEAVGDRAGLATTLNNIAGVYYARGDLGQALDYYEQALPIMEAAGDRAGLATTLNNIGAVYQARGELEQALDVYEQALPIHREVGIRIMEATTLNNIGGVYQERGELEQALDVFEQALGLLRQIGAAQHIAAQLANIAKLLRKAPSLGRQREAIPLLEGAIATMERVGLSHTAGGTSLEELRYILARWRGEAPPEQPDVFGAIANNTVAVMTSHPEHREEWFNTLRGLQSEAQARKNAPMAALVGAIIKLLLGDKPEAIHPQLEGEYAACWDAIIKNLPND